MKLGFLITDPSLRGPVISILNAARQRGDDVQVFVMDDGCRLAEDPEFLEAASGARLGLAVCDLNRRERGVEPPAEVALGSQFDNARMMHDCDKVLVF